jgi:hypothetical protein
MNKGETPMQEMFFRFDDRNLAHLLSALALAGIADEASPCEASRCWWTDDAFWLRVPIDQNELFNKANAFLRNIKWTAGIGIDTSDKNKRKITASPHHGLFSADARHSGNPLISYHDQGTTSSLFKTFSGQKGPDDILDKQIKALVAPVAGKPDEWLFQRAKGVASWKFDAHVGGHAYSQGFSANDDGSGDQSPFYPAIELLSIAGAAFFSAVNAWLTDEDTLCYAAWRTELPLSLAPLASANLLEGVDARRFLLSTSGNAYGKGAAYKHFPEAIPN